MNQASENSGNLPFDIHGRIKCGTVLVPDLSAAIASYRDVLGMQVAEQCGISAELAALWGAPNIAGCASALLQPVSGAASFVRLIENDLPADFVPTTTFGWAAYEHTVQKVFDWPEKLTGSDFDIVGPPREIAGLPYFIPMQAIGPGRELIYLNEVHCDTPDTDLPKANSTFDHMFIAVLAAPDREAATAWYADKLQLDQGETHIIEYTMINDAFGLPAGTQSALTMIQQDRMPIVEVDTYPAAATTRNFAAGSLPPGNAMVTLAVNNFANLDLDWLAEPQILSGPMYDGRRAGAVRGPAGEWLELIELGKV